MNDDSHLDDETIAAFVDGGLDADERQRAEAHLLVCDECRGLAASTSRLATPTESARARPWLVAGGLAAAAGIVLLLMPAPPAPDTAPRTREAEPIRNPASAFRAHSPADGVPVRRDSVVFRWAALGSDATYQLTLSSEAGAILWIGRSSDTVLAPPDSVTRALVEGRTYYWQVDAVLPNLRSASTGQYRLIPGPW
jgi:hypothetical protein